ncbi:DinG family ATP-dependent helicase YoaA [hydrothermal vent metagenome]|uniref:DNA 5'-3' helicase n=1 Tax=hydrothermal vent metagenome TaxID=652676 RepID=A0A3B1CQB4_9ZZZZ
MDCQKYLMPDGAFSKVLKHYEYRPAQLQMAKAVDATIVSGGTLLVEAATGTGKTWAYLLPAILSGKKVIVSTGTKNLQDQLFFKDLALLSKTLPRPFNACMMKGKSNYLCLHRFYQSLQQTTLSGIGVSSDLQMVQDWAMTTKTGDRAEIASLSEHSPLWAEVSIKGDACLGGQCPEFSRCYLTRLKQEAAAADVVVVNHHLFFSDLSLKNNGYGEILPRYGVVIFDEAHLLEEVATQFFGISFSTHRIDDFVRDAERALRYGQKIDPACIEQCRILPRYATQFFKYFRKENERYRLKARDFHPEVLSAGADLFQSFKQMERLIEKLPFKSDDIKHISERIAPLLADLSVFLAGNKVDRDVVYWGENRGSTVFLHTSPLDVSAILREKLFRGDSPIILTSATLSTQGHFDFVKSRLGIDDAEEMKLETAFDYEKQALLYLPGHLPPPSSPRFTTAISDEIVRILQKSEGRAFLLFTSWRNLEAVYQNLSERLPYRLLKQGTQPKQVLIESFRKDISSVLFGTTSFWQGVDVAGEALSCVIIDKLPFASPGDPLTSARIDALGQQGKPAFVEYQIPLAMLSLRQGIGRLIRSRRDRGLIAILDHRITKKSYGKAFLDNLPNAPRTEDFKTVVSFFE